LGEGRNVQGAQAVWKKPFGGVGTAGEDGWIG